VRTLPAPSQHEVTFERTAQVFGRPQGCGAADDEEWDSEAEREIARLTR